MTRPISPVGPAAIAHSLPPRNALHPARKAFHFATGYVLALMCSQLSSPIPQLLSFALFTTSLLFELIRIGNPSGAVNKLIMRFFRPFMRSHETTTFSGLPYFTFSVFLCSLLFQPFISGIAILCLATIDPFAALTATLLHPFVPSARLRNGKSVIGFICGAFLGVSTVTSVLVSANLSYAEAQMIGFFAGFVGALTELFVPTPRLALGPKKFPVSVDDNALIPLVVGAVCSVIWQITSLDEIKLAPALLWGSNM